MLIAFRTDATNQIGTGHFMRCLTLASALKQSGAYIRFVSCELPEHLRDMLATNGIELASLDANLVGSLPHSDLAHSHWLGGSQLQDAEATIYALSDKTWDWLIIDHYALDARWERLLRGTSKRIMVIDDIADRMHECDVLLDQNFYADKETRYADKVPAHCQLLLGPRYALLRDEFRKLHEQVQPRAGHVKRILVFFGGVDVDNYTGIAIEALSGLTDNVLHVDVVIGAQQPCRAEIETDCAAQGFVCHVQTDRMAELMAAADLAIGAGGSATWERCCLGLPTLAICTADNQQGQVANAALEGLLYSPEIYGNLNQTIQSHVSVLIENSYLLQHISRSSMQAVDGRGVVRVVLSMGCSDIEIRTASADDSEKLFQWRNHSSIREVSCSTDLIDWSDHQRWFASMVSNPQKALLIGWHTESPVGVVRFDVQNDEADVSIYLVPDNTSSSGQGRSLLQSAEQWLVTNYPETCKIRAYVLGTNKRSQRLFVSAGYQVESIYYSKKVY